MRKTLAKATISSDVCNKHTLVEARMEGDTCKLALTSDCPAANNLIAAITNSQGISLPPDDKTAAAILNLGTKHCAHASCPVPAGIIRAIEVASGMGKPGKTIVNVKECPLPPPPTLRKPVPPLATAPYPARHVAKQPSMRNRPTPEDRPRNLGSDESEVS